MKREKYQNFLEMLENGNLEELEAALRPEISKGDLDARYLQTQFSLDLNETGEMFDKRSTAELLELSKLGQKDALYSVGWKFRHGDDLKADQRRFLIYLVASVLLGNRRALRDLVSEVELEFQWENLAERVRVDFAKE